MPKDKLESSNPEEIKRWPIAAKISGVTLLPDPYIVTGTTHQEVKFKTSSQLYRMGRLVSTIKPEEIKAYEEQQKKKK